jgi:hypothetical protein
MPSSSVLVVVQSRLQCCLLLGMGCTGRSSRRDRRMDSRSALPIRCLFSTCILHIPTSVASIEWDEVWGFGSAAWSLTILAGKKLSSGYTRCREEDAKQASSEVSCGTVISCWSVWYSVQNRRTWWTAVPDMDSGLRSTCNQPPCFRGLMSVSTSGSWLTD